MSRFPITRRPAESWTRPPGFTLPELIVTLALLGIAVAVGLRGVVRVTELVAVHGAAAEVRAVFAEARAVAVRRGERAAVRIDTARGGIAVHLRGDTVVRRSLARLYRVGVAATRDSAAYGATGLGYGGSNLRIVVRRGAAADTVVVSRLGRVR